MNAKTYLAKMQNGLAAHLIGMRVRVDGPYWKKPWDGEIIRVAENFSQFHVLDTAEGTMGGVSPEYVTILSKEDLPVLYVP